MALVLECIAVLAPSTAQRRGAPLRCAPFGATSTARGALPGGRSGRRDGRHGRTKGWDQGQAAAASAACSGLKVDWVFKHGASDSEEPIGDAAQGAAMAMTALAQFRVAGSAARIVLDGDTGPMIDGGAQPQMAGLTHEDDAAFAAASRHRSDAGDLYHTESNHCLVFPVRSRILHGYARVPRK